MGVAELKLNFSREQLNLVLMSTAPIDIPAKWHTIKPLIVQWWTAFKQWEAQDTFKKAYDEERMTVRSFDADFDKQVNKKIKKGELNIPAEKFFADKQKRITLDPTAQKQHHAAFHTDGDNADGEHHKYWQDRGIDGSKFADPSNFLSREAKYANGLHDLSASLVKPNKRIDLQLFSSGDGVHLAFSPLSKEEDQQVIWKLTGLAKGLQTQFPEFHALIRGYRAEMTRIKIARNYDIGTGFVVTPIANPGQGPQYKISYGLGTTIKEKGRLLPKPLSLEDQAKLQISLRQEALHFKRILETAPMNKKEVNEIVIALRKHAGPFPVYAVLQIQKGYCECFDIVGNQKKMNGRKISIANGTVS